ncbi:FCD domain-containing protein [Streptomyces sp. NPDC047002]|uniref:FadR/GntR family transcriptional regulator n=1 Tax=Streptomyces sp. NPDC047002 TaxID=3155475 RepID=UPI003451A768
MDNLRAPRRAASLSAQVVESLREQITSGAWPVGARIPAEHVLVERLGVGRSTLREALGALVHLGLLEARVGDGTYVRASSELQSALVRRAGASRGDDVLELRAVLEEYAAGAAALRRSDEDLDRLRALADEAGAVARTGDMAAVARTDAGFHEAVVRASGNALLIEMYEHLGAAVSAVLGDLPWDTATVVEHARLHTRLVEAITARDEVGARHCVSVIVALNPGGSTGGED